MTGYPDLRPSVTGHWPPRISDVPLGVPVLGEHFGLAKGTVVGWSARPEALWTPEELLWTPPGTKSLDLAGEIVDARSFSDRTWVVAQLGKRDKYLDIIRQRVRAGVYRLTPALAKILGIDEDGAVLAESGGGDVMAELQATLAATA